MDSFICGSCAVVFYDIVAFLAHKKICIQLSLDNAHQTVEMVQPASVQATVLDADGKSTTFIIINGDVDNEMSLSSRFKEVDATVSAYANPPHNSMNSSQHSVAVSYTSGIYTNMYAYFMVALCNRADHIYFHPASFFFFFFPRLISAVGEWMFTILWHMVWP